ncbi:phosphatidylglycerophosphatase A [Roseovarius azorensis]|uniref:Phosphatidylglycerophosphatase A n=1 Tax=Roseovarius azorensis TaxID=1287727 RepID=A0A1H7W3X2_9RHOB|nr:phosphatidylglycerophosphatase A [Roseovarius azorensis]SEM16236.1 phosphatidylglycerophosphatase A [Roseovarius azorensis]
MHLTRLICTFFYVGYLRPAPGTWGSLAALPLAWGLHVAGGAWLLGLGIVLVFAAGLWATHLETRGKDDHDPSEIVIDEVAGQWLAVLPVSIGAAHAGAVVPDLWPGFVVAFLAFRMFDILKPGLIGWADSRRGALGVMLDDIFAGIAAGMFVVLAAALYHGILGL